MGKTLEEKMATLPKKRQKKINANADKMIADIVEIRWCFQCKKTASEAPKGCTWRYCKIRKEIQWDKHRT